MAWVMICYSYIKPVKFQFIQILFQEFCYMNNIEPVRVVIFKSIVAARTAGDYGMSTCFFHLPDIMRY